MSDVKMPKTAMTSRVVTIEGCYFPAFEQTVITVDHDRFELRDALVMPVSEAIRRGIIHVVRHPSGSTSMELVPEPGSADTLQHCTGCTCKR